MKLKEKKLSEVLKHLILCGMYLNVNKYQVLSPENSGWVWKTVMGQGRTFPVLGMGPVERPGGGKCKAVFYGLITSTHMWQVPAHYISCFQPVPLHRTLSITIRLILLKCSYSQATPLLRTTTQSHYFHK